MKHDAADVIVAGAGPAGAVTALLLARTGIDVLLLDRAVFPRPKACGDCLSIGATGVLHRLGVLDEVLAAPHARLSGWRIIAPDGGSFGAAFDVAGAALAGADTSLARCALAVERAVLDRLLVEAAVAAGARFEQQRVRDLERDRRGAVTGVRTPRGVRRGAVTVGADGLRSVVARRLGARTRSGSLRKLSLTFHIPVAAAADAGEMHVGHGICVGLAPIDPYGRCNLTLVADADRFGRAVAADTRAFVRAAIDSLPQLRGRIADEHLSEAAWLASGPFDQPTGPVAFDGAVLVGDAAGYYDPFTGQGVYQAMASAALLARSIEDALRIDETRAPAFAPYVRARTALLRGPRLVQRGIDHVLRRSALANRAIARIGRAPTFGRAILHVTGDVAPASALLAPRALSDLLLPSRPPENAA